VTDPADASKRLERLDYTGGPQVWGQVEQLAHR